MNKKFKSMLTLLTMMSIVGCSVKPTDSSSSGSTNTSNSESSSSSQGGSSNSSSSSSQGGSSNSSSSSSLGGSSSSSSSGTPDNTGAWDAELVELMNLTVGEAIPFVQLDEESLDYYFYEDDSGFPIVVIYDESDVNLLTDYDSILLESGYEFYDQYGEEEYGYEINFYTKGNLIVQYDYYPGDEEYSAGNEIFVSLLELSEEPGDDFSDAWPRELIESYFNGVFVPSVPGVENYLVSDYMDLIGFVAIECLGDSNTEAAYIEALEAEGFVVEYDTEYEQYFALESTNSVQVDLYTDGEIFTVLLSQPIAHLPAEWPAELLLEYFGVTIPTPEDVNVVEVVDYYDYDQTVVIEVEGDETTLEAYLEVLVAENYRTENAHNTSYGADCIRAINSEETIRIDFMLYSDGIVIEVGHYSAGSETPVEDNREAVIAEICVALFGDSEDAYYFDEDYGCYYTSAIFGTDYTASDTYSILFSILPEEVCYAYSEEPIVGEYNGQEEYANVFFDAEYTVAVEVMCYYHSAQYGYVAQVSVYNFDDYFAE